MNALEKLEKIATMKKLPRRLFQKLSREGAFKIIYGYFIDAYPKVRRYIHHGAQGSTYLICIGDKTLSRYPRKIFIEGKICNTLYTAWLAIHGIDVFHRFDHMLSLDTLKTLTFGVCTFSLINVYFNAEYIGSVQGFIWCINNDMIFEIIWNFEEGKYEITDYYFMHGKATESMNAAHGVMVKKIENGNHE